MICLMSLPFSRVTWILVCSQVCLTFTKTWGVPAQLMHASCLLAGWLEHLL